MLKKGLSILALTILMLTVAVMPVTSSPEVYGPRMDKLFLRVIRSEDAQYAAIVTRELDVMEPLRLWYNASGGVVARAIADGKYVNARPGFDWIRYVYNYRRIPLCDVNFRHALNHLMAPFLGYMGAYSVVPEIYEYWQNPNVDRHDYSRAEAQNILTDAGYILSAVRNNWVMPYDYDVDGTPGTTWTGTTWAITDLDDVVPPLTVMCTPEVVEPLKYDVAQAWVAEMSAIGLTSITTWPLVATARLPLVYEQWNYDIAEDQRTLPPTVEYIYNFFHSDNNFMGSQNPHGMWWDAPGGVDDQIDTLMTSLSSAEQIEACWNVQELIMGGTIGNPLPHASPANGWLRNDDWWNWSIPNVLVGSGVFIKRDLAYIFQPEFKGLVDMKGYTIENDWTHLNMYWSTPTGNRPPAETEKSVIWLVKDFPESLNPLAYRTEYADRFIDLVMDPLFNWNVFTYRPTPETEPWLATAWGMESWTNPDTGLPGVKYWYKIRSGVKWQDGYDFTAEDVKFNWDFMKYWQIPKYWDKIKLIHHTEVYPDNTAAIFLTEQNIWLLHYFGAIGTLLPPQIYDRDWGNLAALLAYTPEFRAYGTDMAPGYAPGTMPAGARNLFGTGPWILVGLSPYYEWAEYAANRNYWMSQTYLENRLNYLFWRIGDAYKDGIIINISDLSTIAYHFYTWNASWPPSPNPNGYNPDADVTENGRIDVEDLTICCIHYTQRKSDYIIM